MNYLDRNEFNYTPSKEVIEALRNFDPEKLCFYTRIYDEGKKSILTVYLSELYGIEEPRVILGAGAEDILKNAVHFYLTCTGNKKILIPQFSWWYYKSIADEVDGISIEYPLHETPTTYKYNIEEIIAMAQKENPALLLIASPNNPTGNGLSPEEIEVLLNGVPASTMVLIDEAYASFVTKDISYVAKIVNAHNNVLISRTFSKFFGLPGLRMGFGFIGKGQEKFLKFSNKYLGYNRISEDIAIAALKSEEHYREVAKHMNEGRELYAKLLGGLPGFKVYDSVANFILVQYPIELKARLKEAFAKDQYLIKFMNEPGIDKHLRITLGRPEQNEFVARTIYKIAVEG